MLKPLDRAEFVAIVDQIREDTLIANELFEYQLVADLLVREEPTGLWNGKSISRWYNGGQKIPTLVSVTIRSLQEKRKLKVPSDGAIKAAKRKIGKESEGEKSLGRKPKPVAELKTEVAGLETKPRQFVVFLHPKGLENLKAHAKRTGETTQATIHEALKIGAKELGIKGPFKPV